MSGHGMDERYVIELGSPSYPRRVSELSDAPRRLFVRGDPDVLSNPCLAVIGTRRATPYGVAVTELAARLAVEANVTVVSGGALGCDQAAGLETLARGGTHIIVLGCGADVVYPSSSAGLIERTVETGGAVVSLAPWGTQPKRFLFPQRNRVIAALSEAVFIGEAGLPSGTFSTAETAMDLGREVLCIPGSIFSPESRGTNYMIGNGASIISDEDALEMALSRIFGTLRYQHPAAKPFAHSDKRTETVLRSLVASPLRSDEIAHLIGLDARGCLEFLSELMVSGKIEQLIDGRYAPTKEMLHALTAFGQNG